MLVLSRKTGERIYIGSDIIVEVRRVAGNRVSVAVEAPRNIRILRGELKDAAEEFEQPAADHGSSQTYIVSHQQIPSGNLTDSQAMT